LARDRKRLARASKTTHVFVAKAHGRVLTGAAIAVKQFDWEYHLLIACALAIMVVGAVSVLFFATG
jgi:hypothetical protein